MDRSIFYRATKRARALTPKVIMTKDKKEEEAAEAANASETTNEESSSEKENLDESKETEAESESTEEIAEDYLGEDSDTGEEVKEEVDYKKRYGDSTREYQKLKEKTDSLSQAISNLEKFAKANPRIVEEIEKAQQLVGAQQGSDGTFIQQQIDEALEPIKKVARDLEQKDKLEKAKTLAAFEKKHPKLFSPSKSKEEKRSLRQKIGRVANTLVETGMTYDQAVERAYLVVDPKAAVQKGKDEAYLETLGEDQAGFASQSSGEGKKSGKPKYTKEELEKAKKFGDKYYKAMLKEK